MKHVIIFLYYEQKIDNAFYIFTERLELIGVRWPTNWRVTLEFHNGLKIKLFGLQIGR